LKNTVLDGYAVIAFLFDEPGADIVEDILAEAVDFVRPVFISAVNWAEVLYIVRRWQGQAGVNKVLEFSRNMPFEIVPADVIRSEQAAEYKSAYRLSLADAFAVALAKEKRAELVTGDPEFKQVEKEIKIHWLR